MKMNETLCALRKQAGLSQAEVAARLTLRGCRLTHRAVSKWERGDTQPNMRQFLLLMETYGVRDAVGAFGLGRGAGGLNALGRARLREYETLLENDARFAALRGDEASAPRMIPLYDLPVSAGTGQFLDGEHYELIDAAACGAPEGADFAVRISGDSMTPRFADAQIVFVEQTGRLAHGDIGIFLLNGDAYCKLLGGADGAPELVSVNPAYRPIRIAPGDELRVLGRVITA